MINNLPVPPGPNPGNYTHDQLEDMLSSLLIKSGLIDITIDADFTQLGQYEDTLDWIQKKLDNIPVPDNYTRAELNKMLKE